MAIAKSNQSESIISLILSLFVRQTKGADSALQVA